MTNKRRPAILFFELLFVLATTAATAAAAPLYDIVSLGLTDAVHTRTDGTRTSVVDEFNEAGLIRGHSNRFTATNTDLGQSAWFFDGTQTINIGLTGNEHTRNDGYKFSTTLALDEAGDVLGYSNRFNGGSVDLGRTAWLHQSGVTIDIGLTGPAYTRNDGYKTSTPVDLNEAGQVLGAAQRFNGSTFLGNAVWFFDGATTLDIGFADAEHTSATGVRQSFNVAFNDAGYVAGRSYRYNGGTSNLGYTIWLFDGNTTRDIGLTSAKYTRATGYKESEFDEMNAAGQVRGYSLVYNGTNSNLGRNAWFYDGATTRNIGFTGSVYTRSDGYEYSVSEQMNDAGQVIGHSDRFVSPTTADRTLWFFNGTSTVPVGFYDAEHSRGDGGQSGDFDLFNASGFVTGHSFRYLGGTTSVTYGRTAWIYNGTSTIRIGLTSSEFASADGYKDTRVTQMNLAGEVIGSSRRFGTNSLDFKGAAAWIYNGTSTTQLGYTGGVYVSSDGAQTSTADDLNEAGQAIGYSIRYDGTFSTNPFTGRTAWFYNGNSQVEIGLLDSEHLRNDGHRLNTATHLNEAGQIAGYAQRFNGGSTGLGISTWYSNGAATHMIGLTGAAQTRNDGYKLNHVDDFNEAGQVVGYAERYNGGSTQLGQDSWFYDPTLEQTFALRLSTRPDGYAYSSVGYFGDDGLTLGSYVLFDAIGAYLGNRAFYFTPADGLHDLGALVAGGLAAEGWQALAGAIRINSRGQLLGSGTLLSGGSMPYLLTPVPEPATAALAALAITLLYRSPRRQRK